MIICGNPIMFECGKPSKCSLGKMICCRHCNEAEACLNPKGGDLCPYIKNKKDLKCECPFERNN